MRFHTPPSLFCWKGMLNGIWRGWRAGWGNFWERATKNCREKSFGNHLKLLIVRPEKKFSYEGWANGNEWETQQTSGITKTKLKFFIVNKRRESGFEGAGSDEMNLMPKLFINLVTFELSLSLFSAANFDFFPFTRLTTDDVAGMKRRLNWKSPPSAEFRSRLSPVLVCW